MPRAKAPSEAPDGVKPGRRKIPRLAYESREEYEARYFEETGVKLTGRKEWQPTPTERVQAACAFAQGASQEAVARFLGVHKRSVQRHLVEEFRTAHDIRKFALTSKMVEKAMEGDAVMLIWLSKQWLGFKDRVDQTSGDAPMGQVEHCLRVEYVFPTDPRANPGPPQHLLEATAREVD